MGCCGGRRRIRRSSRRLSIPGNPNRDSVLLEYRGGQVGPIFHAKGGRSYRCGSRGTRLRVPVVDAVELMKTGVFIER